MALDWLQAQEKAGKNKKAQHRPSPLVLPKGRARVRALETGFYDNRLINAGEEFIIRRCEVEFPRTRLSGEGKDKKEFATAVINGEKFEVRFRDGWMEFLGEIREDAEGNESFVPYHGTPIEAAPTALTNPATQGSNGNQSSNNNQGSNNKI